MTDYLIRALLTFKDDLNRAQHMPSPEGYLSALAWAEFDSSLVGGDPSAWLAYQRKEQSAISRSNARFTVPASSDLQGALYQNGLAESGRGYSSAAAAILNSILGLKVEKAKTQPVSPLTPSLALLQNSRGLMQTGNPPNFAAIFEKLYILGRPADTETGNGVSHLWRIASERRLESDSLLRLIDKAFQHEGVTIVGSRIDARNKPNYEDAAPIQRPPVFQNSPFSWFHQSWTRLTSDAWVDALPAKVWVDWAMCVLRGTVGFSFVWEASWYNKLADAIIDPKSTDITSLLNSPLEIMPWASNEETPEMRNVASLMKWRVANGQKLRREINLFFEEHDLLERGVEDALLLAASDRELGGKLTQLRQQRTGDEGPWEAVTSALTARSASVGSTDHYGFWRKHGNQMTFVAPTTEWMAVLASLSSSQPHSTISLGELMNNLRTLGLRPAVKEVVALLENAGLARGSDDADLGLKIETAY